VTGICQSLFIGGVGLRVYLWFVAIKNILFFLEWNRLSFVAIKKIFTVLWVVNIFCIFAGTGWISSSTSPQKDFEKDYLGSEVGFGLSDIWKFVFSDTCEREY
jgi:hypothetical protein